MESGKRVQSIDRAVMILKFFSDTTRELDLTEIAEKLSSDKSIVFEILNTLKYHGLIRQNEQNQKYSLGIYLLELGNLVLNSLDIHKISAPTLSYLRNFIEESVYLGMLEELEVVYIDKQEAYQTMRVTTAIGTRNPAYCTSAGKAMLAFLDQDLITSKLPNDLIPYTINTITTKIGLLEELSEIRNKGYAIELEERVEGLISVASSIFDHTGQARYAISVSGPIFRMTDEKIQGIIHLLKNASEDISMKLGYRSSKHYPTKTF